MGILCLPATTCGCGLCYASPPQTCSHPVTSCNILSWGTPPSHLPPSLLTTSPEGWGHKVGETKLCVPVRMLSLFLVVSLCWRQEKSSVKELKIHSQNSQSSCEPSRGCPWQLHQFRERVQFSATPLCFLHCHGMVEHLGRCWGHLQQTANQIASTHHVTLPRLPLFQH